MWALYLGENSYTLHDVSYIKGIVQEIPNNDIQRIKDSGKFLVSSERESLDGLAYKPRIYSKSPKHILPKKWDDFNILFKRAGKGIGDYVGMLSTIELLKSINSNFKSIVACPDFLIDLLKLFPCVDETMNFSESKNAEKYMECDIILDFSGCVENNEQRKTIDYYNLYKDRLGADFVDSKVVLPKLDISRTDNIDTWLIDRHIEHDKFIIVHTGGSSGLRKWGDSNWKGLIYKIITETDYKIIITGTEFDYSFEDTVNNIFLANKFSLSQFANLVSKSKLIITTDTGAIHIAGLLNKKTIGLFGNTAPSSVISYYNHMFTVTGTCDESPCFHLQLSKCQRMANIPECMKKINIDVVFSLLRNFGIEKIVKILKKDYTVASYLNNIFSSEIGSFSMDIKNLNIIKTGKNILYITQSEHKAYTGGRYYGWLTAKILASKGFNVYVLTNKLPPFYNDFECQKYKGTFNVIINLELDITKLPLTNFDYVVGEPYHTGQLAVHYGKKVGAKVINYIYETPNYIQEYRKGDDAVEGFWTAYKKALLESDVIIPLSELGKEKLIAWDEAFKNKTIIPIEPSINEGQAVAAKNYSEDFDFLFISMHKNYKNTELFIEAVIKSYPQSKIALVGHGNQSAASKYSTISRNIRVFENCDDATKFAIIKSSKIVVCPSKFEGFGMSAIEALYFNKIIVATDMPITKLNIKDYPHYFKSEDIADLMRALVEAQQTTVDPNIKLSALTRSPIYHFFSNSETYKKLSAIFIKPVKETKYINIGQVTPYNEQCGIAENTKYFLDCMSETFNVHILPPRGGKIHEGCSTDKSRFWDRDFLDYSVLLSYILKNNLKIIHIQHEFSFFRKEKGNSNLIEFIKTLRLNAVKVVVTYHTYFVNKDVHANINQYVNTSVVCNSAAYNLGKGSDKKLKLIPLPLLPFEKLDKLEAHKQIYKKFDIDLRGNNVYAIHGFWNNHKGYHVVLKVFSEILKIKPETKLLIIGTYDENSDYASQIYHIIKFLHIEKDVIILNKYLPIEDVNLLLQGSNLIFYHYLVESHYSASAAARTGISAYTPVITSNSPMFADLIKDIPNFLYSTMNNVTELYQKLLMFETEQNTTNLFKAYSDYIYANTPEITALRHEILYEELLKDKN